MDSWGQVFPPAAKRSLRTVTCPIGISRFKSWVWFQFQFPAKGCPEWQKWCLNYVNPCHLCGRTGLSSWLPGIWTRILCQSLFSSKLQIPLKYCLTCSYNLGRKPRVAFSNPLPFLKNQTVVWTVILSTEPVVKSQLWAFFLIKYKTGPIINNWYPQTSLSSPSLHSYLLHSPGNAF